MCVTPLNQINNMTAPYSNPEVFIQEKFRIIGEKKGSGNTDNMATISSKSIKEFQCGKGPFAFLGYEAFEQYWRNYPKYKDSETTKASLYTDIPTFISWISKENPSLADEYNISYNQYLEFKRLHFATKSISCEDEVDNAYL